MTRVAARRTAPLALLLALIVGAGVLQPAEADEYDDRRRAAEAEQDAAADALGDIDELLEDTDAALVQAFAELTTIESQLPAAQAEYDQAAAELARLRAESVVLEQRLQAAQAEEQRVVEAIDAGQVRAAEVRSELGETARRAYRGQFGLTTVRAVLEAESRAEFIAEAEAAALAGRLQSASLRETEQLTASARNQAVRLTAVREEIVELDAAMDELVALAAQEAARAEQRRVELEELLTAQRERTSAIEAQREAQLAKKAQYEAQQAALAAEIAALLREQAASPPTTSAPPSSGPGTSTSAGALLGPPVPSQPPVITSPYGWRIHPIYGYLKLHAGTDFRAYCGDPIIAAESGTVQWAKFRGGFGNQVMLNHGYRNGRSLLTSYNHLSSFAVGNGDWVERGQLLGYSGTTGTSTACHLHFEAYVDGATVDPETLM